MPIGKMKTEMMGATVRCGRREVCIHGTFYGIFPGPSSPAAVAEVERRRNEREQRSEADSDQKQPIRIGKGVFTSAIAGIVIIALAVLSLVLPIFAHRARRPIVLPASLSKPATPVPTLSKSAANALDRSHDRLRKSKP